MEKVRIRTFGERGGRYTAVTPTREKPSSSSDRERCCKDGA